MSSLYEILGTTAQEVKSIIRDKDEHYLSYTIRKANGKLRWIDAPQGRLKALQYNILNKFLYAFSPHECAVGFVAGIGVADGAARHLNNNVILCMDLKDFFNSIKYVRVKRVVNFLQKRFRNLNSKYDTKPTNYTWTKETKDIAKLLTFKGQVPQGAPTSPALANLVAYYMDHRLQEFAEKHNLMYTRYADDLTFSHSDVKFDMYALIPEITGIIKGQEFTVNNKKTRVMKPHRRMTVTGVVINEKLGVPKYKWRNLRAQLHQLHLSNNLLPLEKHQKLRGQIEWIRSLNPQRGQQLLNSLGKIPLGTS